MYLTFNSPRPTAWSGISIVSVRPSAVICPPNAMLAMSLPLCGRLAEWTKEMLYVGQIMQLIRRFMKKNKIIIYIHE